MRPGTFAFLSRLAASCTIAVLVAGCGGRVESALSNAGAETGGGSGSGAAESGGAAPSGTGGAPRKSGTGGAPGTGGAKTDDTPASCQSLASNCGPSSDESCCESPSVPGGTYYRSYDNINAGFTSQAYPATVKPFHLDKYEVTVGRFRKFVEAYSPAMIAAGAGKNSNDPSDTGWDTTWNTALPTDSTALGYDVQCADNFQTWTDKAGPNENRPINCLTWFEAFAFCAWDGGRLPTEAEWNYVAAGGSEQRQYPWGKGGPDDLHAVFCGASCSAAENVGSKSPTGDGKWGHTDLAGNVYEWLLDWYEIPYPQVPCSDCANTLVTAGRVFRGGAFSSDAMGLLASARNGAWPGDPTGGIGVRCARDTK
jgi:formylglycine-generating enzyme required for sulfatase activity